MPEYIRKKFNTQSIIGKFILVFLLFGSLLVMVTVSIQNDLAENTAEELYCAQEEMSLAVLEKNIGEGEWNVRGGMLYKGETPIGDGSPENANLAPFLQTEKDTDSFVYSFIDTSLADEKILDRHMTKGREITDFMRSAGSTLDASGNSIVGTFLSEEICSQLEDSDIFSGRSFVEGRLFYCYYKVLRDADGRRVGALVAGRSIQEITDNASRSALNSSLAIGIMILYTFIALFLFVAKWNRSIKKMENYLVDIGNGAFPSKRLKISGGDELSEMAGVINDMNTSLKEKERLRGELELAKNIQAEMLPDDNEAKMLPDSVRVSGYMMPAKEVGGDLYDFFMIDEDRLALVIADVSDKGVPAALFMATAKMCIKDHMMIGAEPAEVLKRVNNRLLENNKYMLFVTAWMGILDLKTGLLKFAAAGHPFPYVKSGDAEYEQLKTDRNLVLAAIPDFDYKQSEVYLKPGDRIFLYTDGLDEARDINGGFFGQERIKAYLDEHCADNIADTVSGIKQAVDEFASGREQFDDLTMLFAEYKGGHCDD